MKKFISILVAITLLLCACAQGNTDDNTVTRNKKEAFTPSGQKVESSIFGRSIKYDGFTPAENISLPIESADIVDMLQIEKTLYFLTDGAVYDLDIETGASGKLFDTDATMFASYGDTIYTYTPESGKLCAYSVDGEIVSEDVLALQNEELAVGNMIVTDDCYAFECKDKSGEFYVKQYNIFDRENLEQVNSFSERASFFEPIRVYSSYKGNSLLKIEESPMDVSLFYVYEIDLETGKSTKLIDANLNSLYTISDFAYNPKTDTIVLFMTPKQLSEPIFDGDVISGYAELDPAHDIMFIAEYSLSDPDNIVQKRFYPDKSMSDRGFVSVYENIVSAISSADNEYRYFDYLDPPESITFVCQRAETYEDIICGFEAETGIMVRTVSYGYDYDRLDIKLMAGDTDFDLFMPIYMHQHKYFLADMFEDLSKYEGLKQRLDGNLAAGYVSNINGKYIGIPTHIENGWNKESFPEDGGPNTYSKIISRVLYLSKNIDIADGVFKDSDGTELYKLLRFLYDNPEGNEAKMPFGKEVNALSNEFIIMNPSSTHKENCVKFLEYVFDALNGDIEGIVPEEQQYLDLDTTDDVYVYWRLFAWDYMGPIYEATNTISLCDGKNSTIKEIARKAAAEVKMRLME